MAEVTKCTDRIFFNRYIYAYECTYISCDFMQKHLPKLPIEVWPLAILLVGVFGLGIGVALHKSLNSPDVVWKVRKIDQLGNRHDKNQVGQKREQ